MIDDYIHAIPIRTHTVPFGIARINRAVGGELRWTDHAWARRLPTDRPQVTIMVAPDRRRVTPTGDVRLALASTLALHLSSIANLRS